jgi:hypothetical protein
MYQKTFCSASVFRSFDFRGERVQASPSLHSFSATTQPLRLACIQHENGRRFISFPALVLASPSTTRTSDKPSKGDVDDIRHRQPSSTGRACARPSIARSAYRTVRSTRSGCNNTGRTFGRKYKTSLLLHNAWTATLLLALLRMGFLVARFLLEADKQQRRGHVRREASAPLRIQRAFGGCQAGATPS